MTGGIGLETAPLSVSAGANVLVAGASIFGDSQRSGPGDEAAADCREQRGE